MLYKRNYSFQHSLLFLLIFSKSFLIKHKDHFLSLLGSEVWPPQKDDWPLLTGCVRWPVPCGIWMLISDEDFSILISAEVPCAQNWRAWFFPSGWVPATCPLTILQHCLSSVQFSRSVVSDSLPACGLQHARPPCPSPTPGVHSNSCPSSRWCHPTISFCCLLLLPPSIFPIIRVFSNQSVLHIRWPEYWSFSFSNEYSGLISFRMD